jgi:hypothetical protein
VKSVKSEESGDSNEQADEQSQFPMHGEAVSGFEVVRRYLCSYKINYASLDRLEHLERELGFIQETQPTSSIQNINI